MPPYLFLKVVISFVVAGIWIGGATLIAERLGSQRGGLIANLPSTVLIALIFVALVNDAGFSAEATRAIPTGMTIDTIFLLIFIILLNKSLGKAVFISLISWLIMALIAGFTQYGNTAVNILMYGLAATAAFLILEHGFEIPPQSRRRKNFTIKNAIIRALFAGGVVAGTTIISAFAGTYWVGLFSTFPAVMLSSMVILTLNQGKEFARAVGKIMILSSTNIIVYALGVSITYPVLGIIPGTIVSFGLAAIWVLMMYPVIKRISK